MRMNLFSVCALTIGIAGLTAVATAGPTPRRDSTSPAGLGNPASFNIALEHTIQSSPDPARTRGTLLMRLGGSPACYPDDVTPKQWQEIFELTRLLAPADGPPGEIDLRYYTEPDAWLGEGQIGTAGRAQAANLTYSFPDDQVTWGVSASGFATGPNILNANLLSTFGDLDRGREYVRQALASWRLHAGVRYTEVADDNSAMSQLVGRSILRGDIRIGAISISSSILAYNAYPLGSGSTSLSGGDMCLNANYFLPAYFNNAGNEYRYLRNTVAHEHGHGLGLRHTVPCDTTKIMEPQVGGLINGIQIDDIRGGQRNYGDRFSGNNSLNNAVQLGSLTTPSLKSVHLTSVSTNSFNGHNFSYLDWYSFTISSPQPVVISAEPYGGQYSTAPQSTSGGCTGSPMIDIDAQATALLRVELRSPTNTLLQFANAPARGSNATLNAGTLNAGTYYIQVRDVNNVDIANNQRVQLYDLKVRIASATASPLAMAGISKRVPANTDCWLMGHIHSRAMEPGATITSYDWDLDGDGIFETPGSPATYRYVSNGTHQAVLRVTDSNGKTGTDSINVSVWNALTTVTGVSPPGSGPNTTIPVTITGTNFKGVTNANQVVVSGTGVSVFGTPVVNHLGTQITGLSFFIASGATLGARNVSISNSDGAGGAATGIGVFTVGNVSGACCLGSSCIITTQAACTGTWQGAGSACGAAGNPTTCCRANFDGANGVQVADIFAFLSAWFAGSPSANIDGVNGVAVPDIFAFLSLWFAGC
jgi:hypothetical protein